MSSSKGHVLHIRNLSTRARQEDIRRAFSKYGHISDVTIPLDYYSGRMKGFAFVEFERSSDAREAQHRLDHTELLGREIEIEFARGYRRTPAEMMRIQKDRERRDDRDLDSGRRRSYSRSPSRSPPRRRAGNKSGRSRSRSRSPPPRHSERRRRSPSPPLPANGAGGASNGNRERHSRSTLPQPPPPPPVPRSRSPRSRSPMSRSPRSRSRS